MKALAIDQGTTSTRAILVDSQGSATPLASLPHRQIYPAADLVEHDCTELLRNIRVCLEASADVADLVAIGIDNQGESCLAWNAETGDAISPVIVWQDSRTRTATERLRGDGAEPMVLQRAGLPLDPYFSASKMAWLIENIPEARRLAGRGALRLGTTDAYFLDRLVGRFETDITTASRTSLLNIETGSWDPELCRLFGVPIDALPAIVPTTGDFGTLRSGTRSVPLTASIVDQQASLYGHGCRSPGDTKITFGTGAFALQVTGSLQRSNGHGPLPTIAWQKAGEAPTYALDGGVYCASAAVNWARNVGLFGDLLQINSFSRPAAIDRGIAFVPALAGLACPHWDRAARGAWLGLSLASDRQDMVQAVIEGIALRMTEVVDAMRCCAPIKAPVSIDGGMTANPYFCQFLTDCLQTDLIVSDEPELTALGTACLAAEAAGRPIALTRQGKHLKPNLWHTGRLVKFRSAVDAVAAFGGSSR